MGFSVPDDASKDSITNSRVDSHLRALFALEGRTSPASSPLTTTSFGLTTKVDLPDFGAEATDRMSDSTAAFAASASSSSVANAKPPSSSFTPSNSLAGKRDSFGKLLAPTAVGAKKELQTLLEEDEGEDSDSSTGAVPVPATRHRPRSLNLRSSLILRSQSASTLPTPSPTPSTSRTPKLKSLTLAGSSAVSSSSNGPLASVPKRSSTLVISSSVPLLSAAELEMTHRQSSISYRKPTSLMQQHAISDAALSSLFLGLPPTAHNIGGSSTSSSPAHSPRSRPSRTLTPTMSPTMERRSKSPTELLVTQSSYLAQSHASLLTRIAELEAALGRATAASPALTTSEPSEELLEMLSDLKMERDQLKRSLNVLTDRFHLQNAQRDMQPVTEDDEDRGNTSLHSRSPSSASFSSGPVAHHPRDAIPSDWSFAKAAMRAKGRPKPAVDSFLSSLEDEDESEYVNTRNPSVKLAPSALKPGSPLTPTRTISSPGPFTSSSGLSSSGASGVLSSPGAYSIGFGFGLSGDEDEDSTFNFGQTTSPSPFPKSDESDGSDDDEEEKGASDIATVPLVDEEDATFTFACRSEDSHASYNPSNHGFAPFSSSDTISRSIPSTPSMPKFSDPATPRPRHKAKDSISIRRRHMEKASIDLNGASTLEGVRRSDIASGRTSEDSVVSSPRSEPSYFIPRSPPPSSAKPQRFSMLVAPTLDISIPSSDFGSLLPSFDKLEASVLPPPPPPAMRPPVTSSRSPPPIPPPSPARRSGSREMSLNSMKGKETVDFRAPTHSASRSSISLSLASLASLLPASWSPRASPTSPTGSLSGRASLERALISREKQLNRLAERMGSQGSISSPIGERSQSPSSAAATSQI
ncbi:hypothetical protein FRC17_009751 [Serendipita sp. 399]|nr:hypothetical protein FRC17_009751 [Serendipita sp. 399]